MPKSIGNLLKKLRIKAGYESLGELYRASGVSVATLSRIEAGKQEPSPETLKKLAPFLRVSLDRLMTDAGYLNNEKQPDDDQTLLFAEALKDDPELKIFWKEMLKREELKIFAKQVTKLSPKSIRIVVELIKKVEDIESNE